MIKRLARRILKSIYMSLVPAGTRNKIAAQLLLVEKDPIAERIGKFDDGPVLVIAPHFDDEVAGCGGVIALHRAAGVPICVLFTTDGCRGDPSISNATGATLRARETALTQLRKAESQAACAILGVSDLRFLDGRDGELAPTTVLVSGVLDALRSVSPAVIYHPSLLDAHSDHWATNLLLRDALRKWQGNPVLRGYEIWSPAAVNRVADITQAQALKQQAFAKFVSQIATQDYPRALAGLNMYRSIGLLGGVGYAEGFQQLDAARFDFLVEAIAERKHAHPAH